MDIGYEIENKQSENDDEKSVNCKILLKTNPLVNRFPAINILSSCPSDHGVVEGEESEHALEDEDKLLVVDEDISDSDGELPIKNIAED